MSILRPESTVVNDTLIVAPIKRNVLVAACLEQAVTILNNIHKTQYHLPIILALPPRSIWAWTEDDCIQFFGEGIVLDLSEDKEK